jgi:8-oxo-dGTP pyrophosphatase MutT (NUDIX family)
MNDNLSHRQFERFVTDDQGHTHWGAAGAAGVMFRHTDEAGTQRYLLQHRSPWVQEGNTWSIPGGALEHGEEPHVGAMREAHEELRGVPEGLQHVRTHTDDHGGWAYHTVVMDSPERFKATASADNETGEHGAGWFTKDEIGNLPLHSGFAKTWKGLTS